MCNLFGVQFVNVARKDSRLPFRGRSESLKVSPMPRLDIFATRVRRPRFSATSKLVSELRIFELQECGFIMCMGVEEKESFALREQFYATTSGIANFGWPRRVPVAVCAIQYSGAITGFDNSTRSS